MLSNLTWIKSFWKKNRTCLDKTSGNTKMTAAQLQVPGLGRPFILGALYDEKRGQILTGLKIWSRTEVEDMTKVQHTESMTCEYLSDYRQNSEARPNTSLDGQLSLSVQSGHFSVSGSAKQLTEEKVSKKTESVTYKIVVMTKFEELQMAPDIKVTNFSRFPDATHVVTGIQYGGTAYFTFERNKEDSMSKDETSGGLQGKIQAFGFLSASGSVNRIVTVEETKNWEKIKVTYRGDFYLTSPPISLQDTMKCIQDIKCADARSPVTVTLTPLSLLTKENIPQPVPLPPDSLNKALDCFGTLKRSIATVEEMSANLAKSPWTFVVKQLEASARELRGFEASLRNAAKATLHGKKIIELEAEIERFRSKYPKLEVWVETISEISDVLGVISDKFRKMGVQIIASKSDKANLMLESSNEALLIIVGCPAAFFNCAKLDANKMDTMKLWDKPEREISFYAEMRKLDTFLQLPSRNQLLAAVEQYEDTNLCVQLKKFKNGGWEAFNLP